MTKYLSKRHLLAPKTQVSRSFSVLLLFILKFDFGNGNGKEKEEFISLESVHRWKWQTFLSGNKIEKSFPLIWSKSGHAWILRSCRSTYIHNTSLWSLSGGKNHEQGVWHNLRGHALKANDHHEVLCQARYQQNGSRGISTPLWVRFLADFITGESKLDSKSTTTTNILEFTGNTWRNLKKSWEVISSRKNLTPVLPDGYIKKFKERGKKRRTKNEETKKQQSKEAKWGDKKINRIKKKKLFFLMEFWIPTIEEDRKCGEWVNERDLDLDLDL